MADLDDSDLQFAASPSEEGVLQLTNHLLEEFNIPTHILHVGDISSALFVILYERLFCDALPGIIRQPITVEDEVHNCQTVIDVLSTDVVRENLNHIQGVDVVGGNITAIFNLLDIFSHLLEYVVNKIESDAPTDIDDSRSARTQESERLKGEKEEIGDVSKNDREEEFSNGKKNGHKSRNTQLKNSLKKCTSLNKNENRKVITYEDFYAMTKGSIDSAHFTANSFIEPPSPIKPDQSQSLLGQKTVDSTDIDFETKGAEEVPATATPFTNFEEPQSPKIAWSETPSSYAYEKKLRGDVDQMIKENEDIISGSAALGAASIPAVSEGILDDEKPAPTSSKPNGSHHTFVHHLYHHFDQLLSMSSHAVEDPKTRWAVDLRLPQDDLQRLNPDSDFSKSLPPPHSHLESYPADPLRSTIGPIDYRPQPALPKSQTQSLRPSHPPLVKGLSSSYNDLQQMVEKTAMLTRVALQSSPIRKRAERELDLSDARREEQSARPTISSEGVKLAKELNSKSMRASQSREVCTSPGKGRKKVAFSTSAIDPGENRGSRSRSTLYQNGHDDSLKEGYYADVSPSRSSTSTMRSRSSQQLPARKTKSKDDHLIKHLARNRQPELGAAHMTLKTEDRVAKKKQEILKLMYEEDLEEFADDVDSILAKDKKGFKEVEEKLLKTLQERAPKVKAPKKTKASTGSKSMTATGSKKLRSSRAVGSKPKGKSTSATTLPSKETPSGPMTVDSKDDLLPVLLEEFPFLHLSEHTWHELWRKGLNQIESLTNAYQDSKRKKSQAQCQLEEAAKRHEMLSDIMKKQLEHTKRLRDIRERKVSQIHLKNKVHEKRTQSARARRYYNEYEVRGRSKQLKRRTKEEMVFRELFKDALGIQKERIKDIRQYTSDQRKRQEVKRQNEMESMENFYNDQFEMLAERLTKERHESAMRDGAQQRMLDQMKREVRKKMECEIRQYQDQLYHDEDDTHFRQIDADRVKQKLHLARYTARI